MKWTLAFLLLVALVTTACDPGMVITVVNVRNEPVDIYFKADDESHKVFNIASSSSRKTTVAKITWDGRVIAHNGSGVVVFDSTIPWEELKKTKTIEVR